MEDRSKQIEELEKRRKNLVIQKTFSIIIITILFIIATYYFGFSQVFFMVYFMAVAICLSVGVKEYKNDFKNIFVKYALEKSFNEVIYKPEYGIAMDEIAETNSIYLGDRYTSNDYINAKLDGLKVELSDIIIEEQHTDSDGHTYYSVIYKGRWMIFEFDRKFVSNVTVAEDKFRNLKNRSLFSKSNKVEMESIEFNKMFDVYCNTEHEAFYILTPHMQERLKRINDSIPGKLVFIFFNNKLHIGINSGKDSFEPSIIKKIDEQKIMLEVNKEVNEIISLVKEIKQDNSLFINN